jgi:hypothetical protein
VIAPLVASSSKPPGNAPAVTVKVGAGEPSADTDADTGTPIVNDSNELVTVVGGVATMPVKVAAAKPATFVAVTVNE